MSRQAPRTSPRRRGRTPRRARAPPTTLRRGTCTGPRTAPRWTGGRKVGLRIPFVKELLRTYGVPAAEIDDFATMARE
ncbi:hypothetical protein ACWEQ7_37830, partial [Streptomyces sp. NPDC004069]